MATGGGSVPRRVLVLDDSNVIRTLIRRALVAEGFEVREDSHGNEVERHVGEFKPDLIISDIMMPGRNGIDICRSLRANEDFSEISIILASAKAFDADKRAAMAAGAVAYLVKPFTPEALLRAVSTALGRQLGVTIWGCRGSIASPDQAWGEYGGNTTCVELVLPGHRRFVFDAGTGIRALGNDLVRQSPLRMALLFSHYHWDHTQGLPFFKPLYIPGNEIQIFGPEDRDVAMSATIASSMGGKYFPVSIEAFRAAVQYTSLQEQADPLDILGVSVTTIETLHPGTTLAYRVEYGGRSFVFAPDNELLPETCGEELDAEALRIAEFARGASLLLHDCQYSRAEYEKKRGWGHSCGEALAAVAAYARPERVVLFHHDPDHADAEVEAIHEEFTSALAARGVSLTSEPAREGTTLLL